MLLTLGETPDPGLLGSLALGYLGTFLMVATIGGGLEEPGWRGFTLPSLQQRRSPVILGGYLAAALALTVATRGRLGLPRPTAESLVSARTLPLSHEKN